MRKAVSLTLLALSILLVQFSGMHLHVCLGTESSAGHPPSHYADNGVFFGDHHALDDGDDEEVDLPAGSAVASALKVPTFAFDFSWVIFPVPESVEISRPIAMYVATRGPPSPAPASAPHFLPPLRGPPALS